MPNGDLAQLACGRFERDTEIGEVLENIAGTIDTLEQRLFLLLETSEDDITLLGPFFARTLLESVTTALIGRLDPFRILFVKRMQQHGSYDLGKPLKTAIRWNGDVIDESKGPQDLWKLDKEFRNIERGLLGSYYGAIFWTPAFETLLDYPTEDQDFFADYRAIDPENFVARMRGESLELYSGLSKGIHGEFVIKPGTIYDKRSVLDRVGRTMRHCATLALVSHGIDSAMCRLDLADAVKIYARFRSRSDQYDK